jgi:hypothetical protein
LPGGKIFLFNSPAVGFLFIYKYFCHYHICTSWMLSNIKSTFQIDFPVSSDLSNTSLTGFNTHMYFMWPLLSTSLNGTYMLLHHDPSHQLMELSGNTIMQTSLFANKRVMMVKRIISCHNALWSIRDKGTKW